MSVEGTMKELDRRQAAMTSASDTATVAASKYQAHMTLYNMAVVTTDKDEIAKQRDILHNLLDQILDSSYDIYTHQREIAVLVRAIS